MTRNTQRIKNSQNQEFNSQEELNQLVDQLLRLGTLPNETNPIKALQQQKEINSIIAKLQSLEPKALIAPKRTDPSIIEKFAGWTTENGTEINGCTISYFEDYGIGLKVTKDISESDLVIAVPRKLMLSIDVMKTSPFQDLLKDDQILKNMPNVALAMYLLYIKFSKDTFWKPYIDILPESYTTIFYFTMEELEELKNSPTLETALKQLKSIARQYAYFYKRFQTSKDHISKLMRKHFTYAEYCWAVSTVMTRQNTVPAEDGKSMTNALIPFWDLCNHTNGKISTNYNTELQRSECSAHKDFKSGEQFFIFYGARTNADFFIHNGFVYEENIHDGYWLKMGLGKADLLNTKRSNLLKKLDILPNSEYVIRKYAEPPFDGKLLAFLRVFNMTEEQLDSWLANDNIEDLKLFKASVVDSTLQEKSLLFLSNRLKLLLKMYPTTLDEDLRLLKEDSSISTNKRLAIRMRMTEKNILTAAIKYLEQHNF